MKFLNELSLPPSFWGGFSKKKKKHGHRHWHGAWKLYDMVVIQQLMCVKNIFFPLLTG